MPQDVALSGSVTTEGLGETWTLGVSRPLPDTPTAGLRSDDASHADATIVLSGT